LRRRLLINASLVDVEHARITPKSALLVEDGRITRVGPRDAFATEPDEINLDHLRGCFVTPGFVDPHVHVAFDGTLQAIDGVGDADEPRTWALALGQELLDEVAGYSPADALRSATVWGARALGVSDSRGTLTVGKLADLVVLRGDPSQTPTALRRVGRVMLDGTWHSAGSRLPYEALQ
jgi:imidazolonepropionase-like amidohydrolase